MLTITTKNFENDVLHADKPVLVDFWAQWCPYCRRIAPAFDKVGEQYAGTLITGKINYDEEPQLIQRFGIDTIPTLMLFKNGEVIGSVVAPGSKAAIETFIQETLSQSEDSHGKNLRYDRYRRRPRRIHRRPVRRPCRTFHAGAGKALRRRADGADGTDRQLSRL